MIGSATITTRRRFADDPRSSRFARLKAMPAFDRPGFNAGDGPSAGAPAVVPGFQIHLKFAFRSKGGISVCLGVAPCGMVGKKQKIIGLSK